MATPSMGCEYSAVRGPPLFTKSEAIEGGCVYTFLSIHNPLYKGRAPVDAERGLCITPRWPGGRPSSPLYKGRAPFYAERSLSIHNPLYKGRGCF
jgi:hypothetical protein